MPLARDIAGRMDGWLRTGDIPDYAGAVNGLQLDCRADVKRVASAVDFSAHIVQEAIRARAEMLLVHHGMFWGGVQPLTGVNYERLANLIANDIAVYSSHLPLDIHPEIGNNALLVKKLRLQPAEGFGRYKTIEVGLAGIDDIETTALVERVRLVASEGGGQLVAPAVPVGRRTRRWAVCSGAGADSDTIREAIERGIDTMIVGEGPHHTAVMARDHGIVLIYGGHYATETLGVRALGERVSHEFGIEAVFLDAPTGL